MNIYMTGIDHHKAELGQRELFAFTKSVQKDLMQKIKTYDNVEGCVIINTCNRMELWIAFTATDCRSAYDILCDSMQIDPFVYEELFFSRGGSDAVHHLFEVASGLKSMIFGEEQIITQVNNALDLARECNATCSVLETLFRNAVTAAKKVKTKVRLTAVDHSVAKDAVEMLEDVFGDLSNMRCLVIGNGEMGRLAATHLYEKGCDVKMTLRRYKHADAVIPFGCHTIDYDERYQYLKNVTLVISATTSPHYTLTFEEAREALGAHNMIMFDLAVPRDIDPKLNQIENLCLYDVDDLDCMPTDRIMNPLVDKVKEILNEYANAFEQWYHIREFIPKINEISAMAAVDVVNRTKHGIKKIPIDEAYRNEIMDCVGNATRKVIEKMIFGLKKSMDDEQWEDALVQIDRTSMEL